MPPHKSQVSFDLHSISRSPRKNQANSDPYTQFKSISIPTTKSSQFWCRDAKNKFISTPTLKPSTHLTHTLKPSKIRSPT